MLDINLSSPRLQFFREGKMGVPEISAHLRQSQGADYLQNECLTLRELPNIKHTKLFLIIFPVIPPY